MVLAVAIGAVFGALLAFAWTKRARRRPSGNAKAAVCDEVGFHWLNPALVVKITRLSLPRRRSRGGTVHLEEDTAQNPISDTLNDSRNSMPRKPVGSERFTH